ncbi:MAG: hypothetical protein NC900_05025 [Candidatus Omnitrophica bacterium]|nr:hypothetical protein [Candidatus Omnitrophota bacterium]
MRTDAWLLIVGTIGVILTIFHDLFVGRGRISFGPYSIISFTICTILILEGIRKIIRR